MNTSNPNVSLAMPYAQALERALPVETLTKAELAESLFERIGFSKHEARALVDTFFDVMRDTLESGEEIKLPGFGNFQLRDKAPRLGRNPKTGEAVAIRARRVVTFRANQKLKKLIEIEL